jgi:hypothetical protein
MVSLRTLSCLSLLVLMACATGVNADVSNSGAQDCQ